MGKNWANKAHEKRRKERIAKITMQSYAYKQAMREQDKQSLYDSLVGVSCLGMEYLEMKHGYKKQGLTNFINFIKDRLIEIGKERDDMYFMDVAKYYKDKYDLDILDTFGLEFAGKGTENR